MTKSFLRREEYKALAQLSIDGKILDVGGSKKSGYQELIKGTHTFTTANIDPKTEPDLVFDAQEAWPIETGSVNGVLLVNVLEHIYRYEHVLQETSRVLSSRGTVAGVVPFMFNVHASPNDYFRYTRSALERMFSDAGFTDITIHELGTGAFSVIYHTLIGLVRFNWLATPLIAICAGLDRCIHALKPNNKMGSSAMPLGYYFEARKGS